jgi:hypothetical protein
MRDENNFNEAMGNGQWAQRVSEFFFTYRLLPIAYRLLW